jgi:hypothetical protein
MPAASVMPTTPALISGPGATAGVPFAHADPAKLMRKTRLVNIFIMPSHRPKPEAKEFKLTS